MSAVRTYDHRHLVTLEETNLVGNVYFTNYLRWQGHCRERFLAERAPGVLASLRQGSLALVTVSCRCDYFAELYGMERVELRMSLGETTRNRITMLFDYYRIGGAVAELVARGGQTIACMARTATGMAAVAVPDELSRALAPYSTHSHHSNAGGAS
ncbi:acyl-CoA thioesterase [Rhizohabitans arisaemae]|uniref:acyl-CoA thioesterase n=1 Tax=Rhizohabitans arisaemae TaxID=2720610 RepID=UPI0024B060FD|nr:acyl-CoA thioesterase [Rhizohabitans arisaemae]